eukprot:TRINITY_DN2232_c0_g1_i1.p1 TRINITY_DN2232_c0_g1~~TRINITY_DN2232_c0_g1_i1.p1  ORF type:complete len:594 (+),score=-68.98 TRINITY_DN2232_c0_g1_i1:220-1782(+)
MAAATAFSAPFPHTLLLLSDRQVTIPRRRRLVHASATPEIGTPAKPPPASIPTERKPLREVPGSYGVPLLGAIQDRQDFFNLGADTFFRQRVDRHRSTVFRVNMPPGPPISPDPRVIMLLDAKSFPVLFDIRRVEKRDVFTGTYMPSTDFTGGYRTLSFLDPSEERHTQLKNFVFTVLGMHRDRFIPEFGRAAEELWGTLEADLAATGKANFNPAAEHMALNFLLRAVTGKDPETAGLGKDGPGIIKKWVLCQLAPITSLGLPLPLEEMTLRTLRIPFRLVRKDYERLHRFFSEHAGDSLAAAETFGVGRDEACHNLLYNICFNTWGGTLFLFPSLVRLVGRGGARLHRELAEEVREVVRGAGGLSMRALGAMPLVRSTVYEVLRISPPVAYQYGRAKEDLLVESHEALFRVRGGEMLGGYQPFATRDPRVFADAEEFVPRRFLGEEGQRLLQYVVWSNGPETDSPSAQNKQCAGKDFVVMIAQLLLAELFLRYDSFDIEVAGGALGSSVCITSLRKATF